MLPRLRRISCPAFRQRHRHHAEALDASGDNGEGHYLALAQFCWKQFRSYLDTAVFWQRLPGEHATDRHCHIYQVKALLRENPGRKRAQCSPDDLIQIVLG